MQFSSIKYVHTLVQNHHHSAFPEISTTPQTLCTITHTPPARGIYSLHPSAKCSVLGMAMARLRVTPQYPTGCGSVQCPLPLNALENASVLMAVSVSSSQKEKASTNRQPEAHEPLQETKATGLWDAEGGKSTGHSLGLLANMKLCMSWELYDNFSREFFM